MGFLRTFAYSVGFSIFICCANGKGNLLEIHDPINERFIRYIFCVHTHNIPPPAPNQFNLTISFSVLFLLFFLFFSLFFSGPVVSVQMFWRISAKTTLLLLLPKIFFRNDAMIIYIVIYVRGAATSHCYSHVHCITCECSIRWKYVYDRMSPYPLIYIFINNLPLHKFRSMLLRFYSVRFVDASASGYWLLLMCSFAINNP